MQKTVRPEIAQPAFALPIPTPEGQFTAYYSPKGLCCLRFPSRRNHQARCAGAARLPAQVRQWHAAASKAIRLALAGRAPAALPPLDLSCGTDFQQQVWRALRRIAPGRTLSYAQVARAIGNPAAARAAGGACGANPIPLFVPCHRVLAAGRRLGGFSGGLNWKRKLLSREGVNLSAKES